MWTNYKMFVDNYKPEYGCVNDVIKQYVLEEHFKGIFHIVNNIYNLDTEYDTYSANDLAPEEKNFKVLDIIELRGVYGDIYLKCERE